MRYILNSYFVSFLLGAACRYFYFVIYGYFSCIATVLRIKSVFIKFVCAYIGSNAYCIADIFQVLIVAASSIIIPFSIFGLILGAKPLKVCFSYSVAAMLGVIGFDLIFYLKNLDTDLMISNYTPVLYGVTVVVIWIVLFLIFFIAGAQFRRGLGGFGRQSSK